MRILMPADARSPHARRWRDGLASRGHQVLAVSLERGRDPEVEYIPTGAVHLPNGLRYPLAAGALARLIRRFRPDLVNAHFAQDNGFLAALTGFRPLVVSAWGSDILLPAAGRSLEALRRIAGRARLRYLVPRVRLWTADGRVLTDNLVRLGVPPGKILEVPFGVDTDLFHPPKADAEAGGERELLFVSLRHFHPVYDPLTVVRAVAGIIGKRPRFRAEMAGEGPLRPEASRLAGHLGLGDNLAFPGLLEPEEIAGLLRRAAVYVSAAVSDSTSVSLLEAMACGCFPVAADIPGNRQWIRPGHNGFLFRPGEPGDLAAKILTAADDPELRRKAGDLNRRTVVEKASPRMVLDRIEAVFARVAGEREALR